MRRTSWTIALTMVVCLVIGSMVRADSAWLEQQKLTASDGEVGDQFGCSVSASDDYAIVGADSDDGQRGAAYVFVRDGGGWTEQAKLVASDGVPGDRFGASVHISGDWAAAGASYDNAGSGSTYVFRRSGASWTEVVRLRATDGSPGDCFGASVCIGGDYLIVGAFGDDDRGYESGSAYIFRWNGSNWLQEAKLRASDGASRDYFGQAVSMSADYALVGASGDDVKAGSAYVFKRSGASWMQQAKLKGSDPAVIDLFGRAVCISGKYAVAGACQDGDNGAESGSAYVFRRIGENWIQQVKLAASDAKAGQRFGGAVCLSGNYAIVGAEGDDASGTGCGSVYVFEREGESWVEQGKLMASDADVNDYFGWWVSISGGRALVGAVWDDDNGNESGSAYMFDQVVCPDVDLSGDCFVDFVDLGLMVREWLEGVTICEAGYTDCDDLSYNGCETITSTDASNCGRCGNVCGNDHGTTACEEGLCSPSCDAGWGDCDRYPDNGCETDIWSDENNCSMCGHVCSLPHANAYCSGGTCRVASCEQGYADCDSEDDNGCEVNLDDGGGTCEEATNLGSMCGDMGCRSGPSANGRGEAWYKVELQECDTNPFMVHDLHLRVELLVPSSVDYDLYLYEPCGHLIGQSSGGMGQMETVTATVDDSVAWDNTTEFYIEVRYAGGSSCQNWTLRTYGDCN